MTEPDDARERVESAWARMSRYFGHQDYIALALAVLDLSGTERREVAAEVRRHVAPRADEPFRRIDEPAVAVIGAGVLPDAKATARWLARHHLSGVAWVEDDAYEHPRPRNFDVVPQVFFVLSRRGVDWLPELTGLLADRLPVGYAGYDPRYHLVARLVAETGHPIPTGDGFVACWVAEHDPKAAVEAVVADPRLHVVVTRFFDVEAVGAMIDRDPRWADTVAELVTRGLVARDDVLDACVRRLARGGRPGATRAYLGVHEALGPTSDEVSARVTTYLDLLVGTTSTVAGMARRRLTELGDEGRLSDADTLKSVERGLRRSEKKLVRATLGEVRRAAARDASRAVPLARALAQALAQLPPDLFRDAAAVIGDLQLDTRARRAVIELASPQRLPADLAAILVDVLGVGASADPPGARERKAPDAGVRPVDAGARRVPLVAIATLAELVDETSDLLFDGSWDVRGARLWRVLDGLVRWGRLDPTGLRDATEATRARVRYGFLRRHVEQGWDRDLAHALADLLDAAIGDPDPEFVTDDVDFPPGGVDRLVVDLVHDIARALRHTPATRLVSLPSHANGVLAAPDLLVRLRDAHAQGWEPWDADLDVALLRLVADEPERFVEQFAGIGSAAGRRAADRLGADRPRPPVIEVRTEAWDHQVPYGEHRSGWWIRPQIVAESVDPGDGMTWTRLARGDRVWDLRTACVWPSLSPTRRELIAAQWLRAAGPPDSGDGPDTGILIELAAAEGAFGPAMALALAYGLGRPAKSQAPAVEALIALAGEVEFDAALLGTMLARLCRLGTTVAGRLPAPLRSAADAGGGSAVWHVVRSMLGEVLTGGTPVTGTADLLDLGATLAERLGAHDDVDGLADFAARRGRSRQLVEARRLLDLLRA